MLVEAVLAMHLGFSATTSSTGRLVGRADSGWRLHQGRVDSIGHSARSLSFERWAIRWLLEVQQVPLPELQRGQEDIGSKPRNLRQLGGGEGGWYVPCGICYPPRESP